MAKKKSSTKKPALKRAIVKNPVKSVAKKPQKTLSVAAKPVKSAKKPGDKSAKAAKPNKKAKERDSEFSDDLLLSDDEVGAEELPDLSEFDESASEQDDTDDSAEGLSESAMSDVSSKSVPDDEVVLTDAEGRRLCRVRDCDQAAAVEGYCRYHYLALWKRIQVRRKILMDGKLGRYVEELTSRYPDKFLEMIWKDLRAEKDFLAAIAELEIDESGLDNDFEDDQGYIDEVRGVTSESSSISEEEEF
jgi:hypothetical protein